MECAQLEITGGGSASPATVSFPGAYHSTDPGEQYDFLYRGLTDTGDKASQSTFTRPSPTTPSQVSFNSLHLRDLEFNSEHQYRTRRLHLLTGFIESRGNLKELRTVCTYVQIFECKYLRRSESATSCTHSRALTVEENHER